MKFLIYITLFFLIGCLSLCGCSDNSIVFDKASYLFPSIEKTTCQKPFTILIPKHVNPSGLSFDEKRDLVISQTLYTPLSAEDKRCSDDEIDSLFSKDEMLSRRVLHVKYLPSQKWHEQSLLKQVSSHFYNRNDHYRAWSLLTYFAKNGSTEAAVLLQKYFVGGLYEGADCVMITSPLNDTYPELFDVLYVLSMPVGASQFTYLQEPKSNSFKNRIAKKFPNDDLNSYCGTLFSTFECRQFLKNKIISDQLDEHIHNTVFLRALGRSFQCQSEGF